MPFSLTVDPRVSLTRPVPILVPRSPSPSPSPQRSPYRRYSPTTSDSPGNHLQTLFSPDRSHYQRLAHSPDDIELWFSDLFGDHADPAAHASLPTMQVSADATSKHRPAPLDLRASYDAGQQQHRNLHPSSPRSTSAAAASQPVAISRQYSSGTPMLTHSTSSGASSAASASAATTQLPAAFPYHQQQQQQQQQHYNVNAAYQGAYYDQDAAAASNLGGGSYRPTLHHFSTAPSAPYSFNRSSSYLKSSPPLLSGGPPPHGLEAYHSRSYGPPAVGGMPSASYAPYSASAAARAALQDRPYKCDECVQSFNRNHDLKRHKRIHLSIKPFACDKCGKQFSRKDALRRHWLVKGCRGDESQSSTMSNPLFQRGSGGGAAQLPALSPSSPDEPLTASERGYAATGGGGGGSRNGSQPSLMRTPSTSGPVIVTPSDEAAGVPAYPRHYASYGGGGGGYPASAPTSSTFGYHPSFPLSASSSSNSLHSAHSNGAPSHGHSSTSTLPPLPSPHLNVGMYSSSSAPYGMPSSAPATAEGPGGAAAAAYGGSAWQQNGTPVAGQQQHRYSIAASSTRVNSISSQHSGGAASAAAINGGTGIKDEVLVVQPDGMIEANITETGPQGQVRMRRESRDYFAGVFPETSAPAIEKHHQQHGLVAPSSHGGPGAPPVFAMPFDKGVHVTRSASTSSSNDSSAQDQQQQQQAQNWQRWHRPSFPFPMPGQNIYQQPQVPTSGSPLNPAAQVHMQQNHAAGPPSQSTNGGGRAWNRSSFPFPQNTENGGGGGLGLGIQQPPHQASAQSSIASSGMGDMGPPKQLPGGAAVAQAAES